MNSLWIGIIRVGRIFAYRLAWWLVAVCAILVIVLGTLAFEERSGSENSLSTSIYLAIQLFTLKSGAIDGDVSIMFEIARWLGVGVVFGALLKGFFTAFENRAEAMIVRGLTGHTIICGAGERGRKLAFDLLRDGCFVVLVDPLEDLNKLIDHHLYPRLFLVNADAADVDILARVNVIACKQMFIVGPSDGVNLDIVSETVAAHERKDRASRMYCYVHLESDELFNLVVDSTPAGHVMEMRLFNLRFNAMRAFVQHTRLDQLVARAPDGHFIIVGDSDVVEDVVFMLARTCFPVANEKLPVSLAGRNASARAGSFQKMYPLVDNLVTLDGIDNADIGQAVISIIDQVQKPASVAVIITNESDTDSIKQYLLLQQSGLLEPCQFAIHQTSVQGLTQLLDINQPDSQSPELFGLFDDACDVNTVV
ncbi:MAG: NAD-binding protein, partial [Pirellulaceae bacterium]